MSTKAEKNNGKSDDRRPFRSEKTQGEIDLHRTKNNPRRSLFKKTRDKSNTHRTKDKRSRFRLKRKKDSRSGAKILETPTVGRDKESGQPSGWIEKKRNGKSISNTEKSALYDTYNIPKGKGDSIADLYCDKCKQHGHNRKFCTKD